MVVNKQMSLLAGPKPQKMGYSSPHDQLLVGFVWQSKRPLIISAVVTEEHALRLKPVLPIWLELGAALYKYSAVPPTQGLSKRFLYEGP